jgi:hypothetical protein
MNPEIWSQLPWDLIERIASFADIDTRRALGIPPGRLPKSDFVPRPIAPMTFRYFPALKKLVYINFDDTYDVYTWEVYDNMVPMEDDDDWGPLWAQETPGRHRGVWRGLDDFMYFDKPSFLYRFHFAGQPEIISI